MSVYDAVVIGAGCVGLATAWRLRELGVERVALVERFELGHHHGSSHGSARVTRSIYNHPTYVRLMAEANAEAWPRLERDSQARLIHRTGGYLFGPEKGPFGAYLQAMEAGGAQVEHLDPLEVNRRCPALHVDLEDAAIYDPSSGVVFARLTLRALRARCEALGVDIRASTPVTAIKSHPHAVSIETESGPMETERLIVTAGPWSKSLVPELSRRLVVRRQTVAFLGGPKEALWRIGTLTPWVSIGDGEDSVYYGTPSIDSHGPKVGHHQVAGGQVAGGADDPDVLDAEPSQEAVRRILERARRLFDARDLRVNKRTTCYYTLTPSEDFILDTHPEDPRIVIGAGFSGHGFKFAPLTGRILAELSVNGTTTVDAFERDRDRFRLKA
jgi:sarcosine oxidase